MPRNVLMVADEPGLADARRHRPAGDPDRRAGHARVSCWSALAAARARRCGASLAPVLAGAAGLSAAHHRLPARQARASTPQPSTRRAARPVARSRSSSWSGCCARASPARRIGDLLVELREPAEPGALRDALARALRDPTLELAYWVPEYGPTSAPTASRSSCRPRAPAASRRSSSAAARRVAALIHDASLRTSPQLVGAVTSAAGIALENERLQADLRARLADLRASRARIVEAGDTARRKLERDLHDGAQQRLVSLSVVLRVVAEPCAATEARAARRPPATSSTRRSRSCAASRAASTPRC